MKQMNRFLGPVLMVLLMAYIAPAIAQKYAPSKVTVEDYARAEKFLAANTHPLVLNLNIQPVWLDDHRFYYRNETREGSEFLLVDAAKWTTKKAFDHAKLAAALSSVTGKKVDPAKLPFTRFTFINNEQGIQFTADDIQYQWNLVTNQCKQTEAKNEPDRNSVLSPDGTQSAFIRDYNLWIREVSTGKETQLTTDGVKDFGYATDNAGWTQSERPILLWSPNSKMIATFKQDERGVGEMYLATTNVGHPTLKAWKYPLPEDTVIFRIHRVVIHLDGPRVVRLDMPPDQHRSTITDHIADNDGNLADAEWSADDSLLAFVSSSRDHKTAILRVANPLTGAVRDMITDTAKTFIETGSDMSNWRLLSESNEVIWFSERDNWGHLYLYDLTTGQLKHQITRGNWLVLQLLKIDREKRALYFTAAGKEPGDPYFQYLYSIGIDGKGLRLHTPDSANHVITLSPTGRYFIDSYSTPVTPPVTIAQDTKTGKKMILGRADVARLLETGWIPPVPIMLKARDGATDLYGLLYKPTNLDPLKKYPIINYIYPGPQSGSVGGRIFTPSWGDRQSIAELGFIVVAIDAMGTPGRSKSFHEFYYGNMGDNGIPDQIAGMKQLAGRYSWIDIDRAGIYGHSGGGFASTDAILRYPDFFKVAVSGAGNHDNRNYEDDWGEKWQGLLETLSDGTSNYDNQANELMAGNLKGKLLLAHGTMDDNVPYYNTLLVVNALIAANKDFDLILFPNRTHGFGNEPYMMRRRWDYFVKNLLGAEPPKEYEIKTDSRRR